MKCTIGGSNLKEKITDLPFKTTSSSIIIIKSLPVMECERCREFLLKDTVMNRVDDILDNMNECAELEIIKYAA